MIDLNKFRNITFKTRTKCVICDADYSKPIIELPNFPLTEIYTDEKITEKIGFLNQAFHFCKKCGQGQIANIISPDILYGNTYVTRTSTSQSATNAVELFLKFIGEIIKDKPLKNIIEIGCNDLYILKRLRDRAERLYGIDPILRGKENQVNDSKIEVMGDFIENVDFQKLNMKLDLVLSSHTLEHIDDPKKMIKLLVDKADAETLFFFQFPGLESLIINSKFDQIFHQHLNYFSLQSVIYLLEEVGAELINFRVNPHHWGALMIAFRKNKYHLNHQKFKQSIIKITEEQILNQYQLFKDSMDLTNRHLLSLKNETIYGYGAALMLPILNYYIKNLSQLKCIIDDDKTKEGLYYLSPNLKINALDKIKDFSDSIILVTAINSKLTLRAITAKMINLNVKDIILPVNLM